MRIGVLRERHVPSGPRHREGGLPFLELNERLGAFVPPRLLPRQVFVGLAVGQKTTVTLRHRVSRGFESIRSVNEILLQISAWRW